MRWLLLCGAQALGAWASAWLVGFRVQVQKLCTGLVAPWHVESFWTRGRACVPSIGRQILNHWTTREDQPCIFNETRSSRHYKNQVKFKSVAQLSKPRVSESSYLAPPFTICSEKRYLLVSSFCHSLFQTEKYISVALSLTVFLSLQ